MRWIAASLLLFCLPAGAHAEELCGGGWGKSGRYEVQVLVSKEGSAPPRTTYVHVGVPSADGSHRLSVAYDPTEAGLGTPTMARVTIFMPLPNPEAAEPEQIEWRPGAGEWFNPHYWDTPRHSGVEADAAKGSVDYTIAQGKVYPYRTELLRTFDRAVRWEFRRLDKSGRVIWSGAVNYPAPQTVAGLYAEARRNAISNLGPCRYGPPIVASPAPLPPAPARPFDPAALDAGACALFKREEKRIAETRPQSGRRTKLVEQSADCAARSVRQVYEMDSFSKSDRKALRATLQPKSEKMWCSSALYRGMIGRGWTFTTEFRGAGDPDVVSATTRKCPGQEPQRAP